MKHVLIVDADGETRAALTSLLETEGYVVTDAADGPEGLRRALWERPDVVLYDWQTPGLGAVKFLAGYRKIREPALVIVMCAYGSDAALAAMQAGAYDVLPKPFTAEEALLTLRKAELREGSRGP